MKKLLLTIAALAVSIPAYAYDPQSHSYVWQQGYGHWNDLAADINNGVVNGHDYVTIISSVTPGTQHYWETTGQYDEYSDSLVNTQTYQTFNVDSSGWILNNGTGTPDFSIAPNYYSQYWYGNSSAYIQYLNKTGQFNEVFTAHTDGWNGKGFSIDESAVDWHIRAMLAPKAVLGYHYPDGKFSATFDSAAVCKQSETVNNNCTALTNKVVFNTDDQVVDTMNASLASLVWHKFDVLTGPQVQTLVDSTMTDNGFIGMEQAMSPVGLIE